MCHVPSEGVGFRKAFWEMGVSWTSSRKYTSRKCNKLLNSVPSSSADASECWFGERLNFSFNVGGLVEVCDLIHSWSGWVWVPVGSSPTWMFYRRQHTAALDIIRDNSETYPRLTLRSAANQSYVSVVDLQSSVGLCVFFCWFFSGNVQFPLI